MTADDVKPIIRTLRDVLLEARVYVAVAAGPAGSPHVYVDPTVPPALLERVDGAIAEADEVLS